MKYMLKNRFILLFAGILLLSNSAKAGEKFCILSIFDKYGYKQGVTMLEASKELLKQYKIKQFKSIIFEDGTKYLPEIRACLEKDKVNAEKIKEVIHDGQVTSGFYRLKTDKNETKRYYTFEIQEKKATLITENLEINRYLIFKVQDKKVTLVYVEGALTTEELIELLK
jgi:hypothetical protein